MDHKQVGTFWDQNAEAWTQLSRLGYDTYRDYINTPAFLAMLPNVDGLCGLDIGCGEGHNTRLIAKKGARMSAIDISSVFNKYARKTEQEQPLGIEYRTASALDMPYDDEAFDFAVATMSFMDIPETDKLLKETWRVLKPGGFLQFSILHPCFFTPRWGWIRNDSGEQIALLCGDYFSEKQGQIEEWIFSATPADLKETTPKFKTPYFRMTLSHWLNALIQTGFQLEQFSEPTAKNKDLVKCPGLADSQIIAYFLIIRCRKNDPPENIPGYKPYSYKEDS